MEAIRGTNDDAAQSKLSAVKSGYLVDDFIGLFQKHGQKRAPIMNRGTYLRTIGINSIIKQLSDKYEDYQIVSLGAGSDTRFWCLDRKPRMYFEIDFIQITSKKAMAICKSKKLKEHLAADLKIAAGGSELISSNYCLIQGDLNSYSDIAPRMVDLGLRTDVPTLFLSECVLMYMDPEAGDRIIQSVAREFSHVLFLTYEPFEPSDAFGMQMIANLSLRSISLPSVLKYPSLASQSQRYTSQGFTNAKAIDLLSYWKEYVSNDERKRIEALEMFDEIEEWELFMRHYCFILADKGTDGIKIL